MSEGHLDGRRLLIKSGSDYSGRPEMNSNAVALATGKEEAGEGDAGEGEEGEEEEYEIEAILEARRGVFPEVCFARLSTV